MQHPDPPEGALHMTRDWSRLRLGALMLLLAALLAGLPNTPTSVAQDATETPADGGATGLLTVNITYCVRDDQADGTVTIVAQGGTDGLDCQPGALADISVDGGAAVEVHDGGQVELPVGAHTITETTQGTQLDVEITEGAETFVEVTTAVAPSSPTATATAEAPSTGSVRVVSHLCREGIDTNTLAGSAWTDDIRDCPALTLPGNSGDVPADSVSANNPNDPIDFDVTLDYQTGGAATSLSIADATFTPGKVCESDLGQNLNGVANDDRCWDLSGYQVDDVDAGAVTVTANTLPAGFTLGGAKLDGGETIATTDPTAGTVSLDTSTTANPVVHLFFVPEPAEQQVTIVSHLCGEGVSSRTKFIAIGDFWAQINACPSIVLSGDTPAPDAVTNGPMDFGIEVEGANLVKQQLSDAQFTQRKVCEADLPVDINGDPNDNVCLDLSQYDLADVAQGPITIRANKPLPDGSVFLGIAWIPNSGDDATQGSVGTGGTIKLDTTNDGHVTVHVFFGPQPPTPTPTATKAPTKTPTSTPTPGPTKSPTKTPTKSATPGGPTPTVTKTPGGPTQTPMATNTAAPQAGSLQIFKFWCEGDASLTRINALAPGADATRNDLGDATCQNGNSDFILFDANGNQIQTLSVPPLGVLRVDNLAAGNYSIKDTRSSATGRFEIRSTTLTKVISLHYEAVEEIPDAPIITPPDLGDEPPPPPDVDVPADEEGDFTFDGPVAVPDSSNPFTVVDDPEAEARVASVDTFEELPGVGIGSGKAGTALPWMLGLLGVVVSVLGLRLRSHRSSRNGS